MALPAAHILLPMIVLETYRRYFAKQKFSFFYTFLAGIAGALPDVDVLISMVVTQFGGTYVNYHRSITHSLIVPLLIFLLCISFAVCARWSMERRLKKRFHFLALFFLIGGFGILSHASLDCLAGNDAIILPLRRVHVCSEILFSANAAGILDGILVLSWFFFFGGVLKEIRRWYKKCWWKNNFTFVKRRQNVAKPHRKRRVVRWRS